MTPERLIYKFDFKDVRFIFLWSGKYDYRSPSLWDADRPKYAEQMQQLKQWLDESKAKGIPKTFITFHYPVFCRAGLGPIPQPDNPHAVIASYAKDIEIVVFNGHVHTTEMYDVDGVKYLVLGGGGADGPHSSRPHQHQSARGLSARSLLEGSAAQGGLQLRSCRRRTGPEDKVHPQSLPALVGRAVRQYAIVHLDSERFVGISAHGDGPCNHPWPGRGRALGRDRPSNLSVWAPAGARPGSFFGHFRAVRPAAFANAFIVLYTLLGRCWARSCTSTSGSMSGRNFERDGYWHALGLFDLKEHFIAIGLGLLPAYWVCWRRPIPGDVGRTPRRADRNLCLHRLVGLSAGSRLEQHPGLRRMMSAVSQVRLRLRNGVRALLRGRAVSRPRDVYRLPLARHRRSGHPPFPRRRRSRHRVRLPEMLLVRLDSHGRDRRALRRPCRSVYCPTVATRWCWPWALWVAPIVAMIASVYHTVPWFRR